MPTDKKLVVRIDPGLLEAVKAKAKREDLTVSQVVRHFLRQWVSEKPPGADQEQEPERAK
ncbi:MAG: ribbon-helix-helix protein, CopG family [Anaerolineae bacterium]|nr:ribbon-helix-helix protein, CopG family [Anaerolineae bacterium]